MKKKWNSMTTFLLTSLLTVQLVFNMLLINNFFPVTEGWFQDYSRYMDKGFVFYKDFYCPIPPIFLLLTDYLCKVFGNSMMTLRIYGVFERLVLIAIVFYLVRKISSDIVAFFAVLISSIIYTCNVQDIFYGYYQTSALFAFLALLFCVKMEEEYDDNFYLYAGLFGFFSGWAFLIKQNTGALLPVTVGLAFLYTTYKKDLKKSIKGILLAFTVAMLVVFVCCLYLNNQGALLPFINQILKGASSKGSLQHVFFGFLPKLITEGSCLFFLDIIGWRFVTSDYFGKYKQKVLYTFSFLNLIVLLKIVRKVIFSVHTFSSTMGIVELLFIVLAGGVTIFLLSNSFVKTSKNYIICSVGCTAVYLSSMFWLVNNKAIDGYNFMYVREIRQYFLYALFFVTIIYIAKKIYDKQNEQSSITIILCSAAWMFMYLNGMSAIIEDIGSFLAIALFLCVGLECNLPQLNLFKNICIVFLGFFMVFSISVQRNMLPYHWWGVNEMPPTYSANYIYKDPLLKGIYGEEEYVRTLNEIYDVVVENKRQGDTMFTFPHINYFNVMANLDSPTFSKVEYFDVCSDETAIMDSKILRKSLPSFIVWQEFPEESWEIHESIFRNKNKSGQRALQDFYKEKTTDGSYILLGKFILYKSDPIYVWGINDGRKWER